MTRTPVRRRVISLWFPYLAAERVERADPQLVGRPLAIAGDRRGALVLTGLNVVAEVTGLRLGMTLSDARAISPKLVTRPEDAQRSAAFLSALQRWAERFSPWIAVEGEDGLTLDVTGCSHLFDGELGLVARIGDEAAGFGITVRLGLADTVGGAWAVARHAGAGADIRHAGDAIDQEARATRSRAGKRGWQAAMLRSGSTRASCIVPPGETLARIGGLPVAALRLEPAEVAILQGLGLRRIVDVAALPRTQLSRRVGPRVVRRLDQALGRAPEPLSPAPAPRLFTLRLTFPEPIGTQEDVLAGVDRLLPPLCQRLEAAGCGVRRARLTLIRTDGTTEERTVGLARPANRPEAIRRLLQLQLETVDAGFGIEVMRLEAVAMEPVTALQHRGQLAVSADSTAPQAETSEAMTDLLSRVGARLGLETLIRLHPAESHIPEKSAVEMAAAFISSAPATAWAVPAAARPVLLFPPETVTPQDAAVPPGHFVWRRRSLRRVVAFGPERITPEWWLDDPAWRSGPRDYWRVETEDGTRMWLFEAKGGVLSGGWFAQGLFE